MQVRSGTMIIIWLRNEKKIKQKKVNFFPPNFAAVCKVSDKSDSLFLG